MPMCQHGQVRSVVVAVTLLLMALSPTALQAKACTIESSACYPWRIETLEKSTTLLEIVPNNARTGVIYRVCLCPPAEKVDLIFDFQSSRVKIGTVETKSGSTICRDFRIATARKSRLLLNRPEGAKGVINGCYVTQ